jgi:hypothetical protein
MPKPKQWGKAQGKSRVASFPPGCDLLARIKLNKGHQAMTKTLEVINEAIRNPKHPFRKVEDQPKKSQKHRYERRKIRGYLQLGEWASGEAA